jgi:O-antigen biosynthesis protein
VRGKFLFAGDEKFYVRGVTYGTFREAEDGNVPDRKVVAADFAAMTANGINTVRTYTVPPEWLLDLASLNGLRVLVGVPWEQHVTFLDDRRTGRSIEDSVRAGVRRCALHPAVLGYFIGNEIPAGIVRWHGRQRVERFLERLFRAAKAEDPTALVTYANYPSTEYLHLPFLDLVCFNVFLEDEPSLAGYLSRLQLVTGDRPLVISEIGLDSRRHGPTTQARTVGALVRSTYSAGCAGCFVFAWTDEWNRGGHEVDDWDFGLVDRAREPKPALEAVRSVFQSVPFAQAHPWPRVSVVVCTYDGARTIGECVAALLALDYPDYEVIVVDGGSTDGTGDVASGLGIQVIRTENRGLSAARNTGTAASTGEIVAFCDDDCRADPHWLRYLVSAFSSGPYAGVGGPNMVPPDTVVAESVGHAPGGPTHVLISASEAEHIPGCNMSFRRSALEQVGGFDPQFRTAGDDVDICWRIQNAGGKLGFSPGALVWHRARGSATGYVRQQVGYGRAEALLERKWPERYNGSGHLSWEGLVHGGRVRRSYAGRRWQVYYGASGSALFQSVYRGGPRSLSAFPMAPEWYLLILALGVTWALGLMGDPLPFGASMLSVPLSLVLLLVGAAMMLAQAAAWAWAVMPASPMSRRRGAGIRCLTFALCLLQPLARLWGRTSSGLTPWRLRGPRVLAVPRTRQVSIWSECWMPVEDWVGQLEAQLRCAGVHVLRGGDFSTWDLQVGGGALAAARIRAAVEEHGRGRQVVRFRVWPRWSRGAAGVASLLAATSAAAFARGAWTAGAILAAACLWLAARILTQAATAVVVPTREAASLKRDLHPEGAHPSPAQAPEAQAAPTVAPQVLRGQPWTRQPEPSEQRG